MSISILIVNRKARFKYHFLEYYVAGIELLGTEVKSIKKKKVNITESFCKIINGELFSVNMYIAEYEFGKINNHEPNRIRKLLLNKKELIRINKKLINPGITIIPIELFFSKKGYIKMKIVLAKGKKDYDKREILKKKYLTREMKQFFN
ncbi:SsrA-binding protein SmpB [Blattabacterium cuenoti]|uniref:SsrA-binding protein SmpB n=1 Tax=Blattabacterium cuenoti TaxID=1653831 RepID=UPI001EEA4CEF|nr:SsrA-binding protein SmpB [Blattabacterium cuenoti]